MTMFKLATTLDSQGVYPCPVCRVGEIAGMPMMESMACDFCEQIFTIESEKQQLRMPARQPALIWHWSGKHWTDAHIEGMELGWGYWVAAFALVFFPTSLIGSVAYFLPPTPGATLYWLPYIWTGLTFFSHLAIIVWLFIEVYQFPVGAYFRALRQRFYWG
jgi:hypothetical protein